MARSIVPRIKLLISYDINENAQEAYFRFVLNEMVPALQDMGIFMLHVYHTAYGPYPVRQLDFVAESLEIVQKAMQSDTWEELLTKLQGYTSNYSQKIVQFRDGFQF